MALIRKIIREKFIYGTFLANIQYWEWSMIDMF